MSVHGGDMQQVQCLSQINLFKDIATSASASVKGHGDNIFIGIEQLYARGSKAFLCGRERCRQPLSNPSAE